MLWTYWKVIFQSDQSSSQIYQTSKIMQITVQMTKVLQRLTMVCLMSPHIIIHMCIIFNRLYMKHNSNLSQLRRLWYLSHRRPPKAQASLLIRTFSPQPSLFPHMKYRSRRRVRLNIRHLAPLDGCACVFEECVYGGRKVH